MTIRLKGEVYFLRNMSDNFDSYSLYTYFVGWIWMYNTVAEDMGKGLGKGPGINSVVLRMSGLRISDVIQGRSMLTII